MITSQGGSDSEGDIVKNVGVISTRAMGKVQKRNRGFFSPGVLEKLKTPRGQLKPVKVIASTLSPFAKVFIPRAKTFTSSNARNANVEETTNENLASATVQQYIDLKEGGTRIDKVTE